MKKYLLVFLIFNSVLLFSQESIKIPLIYLSCKKVEQKGNEELNKCFKQNFRKDFYKMVSMELRSRNLITNYFLKAKFNFVFDENGIISISDFEGSKDTKDILEKSLFRLNERIRGSKYKIIPAKNDEGKFLETTIKVPFQYAFVRS
ncbi:hypothetical protein [Empedobacter brevis]|uniref:TonB C-terminal domain-containing protein n=2 Tax=Empedobacter brevis TaxID=247 RepID=A0A511NJT1_9FLAO|nr:hypothetical protein [Empedobacter brevis]GEM52481.1 hypothetical protein EB1_22710 [Empedobacter brevis NBRC 14943 = ATCC 43319]